MAYLCTNAAQAMEPEGGILTVSLSQIELSDEEVRKHPGLLPGRFMELSVQDSGHGIPAEIMGKIYEPYFTTKEKGKGTGLGLATVHGIVQSYGGAIRADSRSPGGTTFDVLIPTIAAKTKSPSETVSELPRGREHVLIVDDEPDLIDMSCQLLEKLGYRVSAAGGGSEALEMIRQAPLEFDLVITDLTMPKMKGDRLAAEMLKIRPDLPIILSTGYSAGMPIEQALKFGEKAFIQKPIIEAELARVVRRVLNGSPKNP